MNKKNQIIEDLDNIINICQLLKSHPGLETWNINRVYNHLVHLQNDFETELKQFENDEIIPF